MKPLLILLRVCAVLAGLAWLALCLRAGSGPGSYTAEQARTALFVTMLVAATFGWPPPPRQKGGRRKERL